MRDLIGRNIKRLRTENNVTQRDLCDGIFYCNASSISHWENGKLSVPIHAQISIANFFKVPLGELTSSFDFDIETGRWDMLEYELIYCHSGGEPEYWVDALAELAGIPELSNYTIEDGSRKAIRLFRTDYQPDPEMDTGAFGLYIPDSRFHELSKKYPGVVFCKRTLSIGKMRIKYFQEGQWAHDTILHQMPEPRLMKWEVFP